METEDKPLMFKFTIPQNCINRSQQRLRDESVVRNWHHLECSIILLRKCMLPGDLHSAGIEELGENQENIAHLPKSNSL